MKCAIVFGDGRAACCLCRWEITGTQREKLEKLAVEHLRLLHDRFLLDKEVKEKDGRVLKTTFFGANYGR